MGYFFYLKLGLRCIDLLAWPLLALGYPLCASIQAIENDSYADIKYLISYWILLSLTYLFEYAFGELLEWILLWPYFKLAIIFWLVIPDFRRSFLIYEHFVHPCISMNPQGGVISRIENWNKLFAKKESFSLQAEEYIKENGTEALEKLISSKNMTPNLDKKITTVQATGKKQKQQNLMHSLGAEAFKEVPIAEKKQLPQTSEKVLQIGHMYIKVPEKKEVPADKNANPTAPNLALNESESWDAVDANRMAGKDHIEQRYIKVVEKREVPADKNIVCRRLQDCPPADRSKMMGSKSSEVVQHETLVAVPRETLNAVPRETLPDLCVDHLLQRSSVLSATPSSSNSFATGARPLSAEVNRVSIFDPKALQQEVTFRILCSNDRVGGIIGKGGNIVRALQNETGATISVGPSVADCEDRLITVTALENPESVYSPAQKGIVLVFARSVEAGLERGQDSGSNKGSSITARLVVPTNQVGCLLGKGGAVVSEMRKATGTSIRVIGTDQVPKCAADNDQVVQISGEFSNVQDALYSATGRLRDNLFASTQNNVGTRSISSALVDTSPHGRLRDPIPSGAQPVVGNSHSLSRHTLTHSMDHLGVSRNLDRPSSPGLWTSQVQTVAGINSRGLNDVGRGLTSLKGGLELGSGSKTAIVTNTTVEMIVPNDVIGSVYGENGSNLVRLRQISGAKVIVQEPRPGTSDRTIFISGTPDETRAAQSLLQAFILTGSS